MKILILTAMKEELDPLIKNIKCEKVEINFWNEIYQNKEFKNTLYFTTTGIGKVNAAISTTNLISLLNPDIIINFGTAGGIDPHINVLDIVIANKLAYHDVDVTAFGYELGQVPGQDTYLETDIPNKFLDELKENQIDVHIGTIVSGDQFIDNKKKQIEITNDFRNVYAVEMESAAIVDTCKKNNVKSLVVRGISDLAYEESKIEFDKYLEQVGIKFQKIIDIIKNYEKI